MAQTHKSQTPSQSHYDVVIIGGAMLGSSAAWFLSNNLDFDGSILVVEKDPTYEWASTSRTNSCMRQQFSREINIRISQFAAEFVTSLRAHLGGDDRVPDIPIQSFGYMYLADNALSAQGLKESQITQAACGAGTKFMTAEEIKRDYPFYNVDDIFGGNHNLVNEGYFDGNTVFDWWKRKAREAGVEYIANEVVAMQRSKTGRKVDSLSLKSGDSVFCGQVINASGPRAAQTANMAGIKVPVEPRKRYTFIFDAASKLDHDLPLTVDPSGIHVRTDGLYYLVGCAPEDDRAVDYDDFVENHEIWQDKVWPTLAHRIPQFEAIKLINSWVGHYAFNVFDQNAILGPHYEVENFIFLNGFSGHGFQQSPAMGRGTAEWICYGEYRTLDLTPFHFDRIRTAQPFVETAVI